MSELNDDELKEALLVTVDWHKDVVDTLTKMSNPKVQSIQANVKGELIDLVTDPRQVKLVQLGFTLALNMLKDFPVTIETKGTDE